jgi:hypothetical protein
MAHNLAVVEHLAAKRTDVALTSRTKLLLLVVVMKTLATAVALLECGATRVTALAQPPIRNSVALNSLAPIVANTTERRYLPLLHHLVECKDHRLTTLTVCRKLLNRSKTLIVQPTAVYDTIDWCLYYSEEA